MIIGGRKGGEHGLLIKQIRYPTNGYLGDRGIACAALLWGHDVSILGAATEQLAAENIPLDYDLFSCPV